MDIKYEILKEIQARDLKNGLMDISLKSASDLSSQRRREILFELAKEKKIVIKNTRQIQDEDFPLLIVDCIR